MIKDAVISVTSVSKAYRMWKNPASRLTSPILAGVGRRLFGNSAAGHALRRRAAGGYRDFWALSDISFDVRRGEALGIIGRNGSGKSTLLQIIAGTLEPTIGTCSTRGRVAALLELGSGFNPEFTGRENVFLYGAVLGLPRAEIQSRFEAIRAFADIGEYIDHPVRTYSSGMQMRLAFAVAAHIDPEVLIVDEALSVGDARFQLKCARAIDRFIEEGVTLLFVSHDLNMVKRLCSRAILLEKGRSVYVGKPNDVANLYSKLIADGGTVEGIADDIRSLAERSGKSVEPDDPEHGAAMSQAPEALQSRDTPVAEIESLRMRVKALETQLVDSGADPVWRAKVDEMVRQDRIESSPEFAYGGELGRIVDFCMRGADGEERTWFTTGEQVEILEIIEAHSEIPEPIFTMRIKDKNGQEIYGTNTLYSRQPSPSLRQGDRRRVRFVFQCHIMPGEYFLSLGFTQFVGSELVVIHRRYDAALFAVHGIDRSFGIANCHARITVESIPAESNGS